MKDYTPQNKEPDDGGADSLTPGDELVIFDAETWIQSANPTEVRE